MTRICNLQHSNEQSDEMKRSTSKFLVIFCILLAGRGISTQQLDGSGSGDSAGTTGAIAGNTETIDGITEAIGSITEVVATTSELPSEIIGTTLGVTENAGDDDIFEDKVCMCDCKTGIIFTDSPVNNKKNDEIVTDGPEIVQETQIPIQEEAITEPDRGVGIVPETTITLNDDVNEPSAKVTEHSPTITTEEITEIIISACLAAGNFSNNADCHAYSTCSLSIVGNLERSEHLCPPKMAFNIELSRCTRDISSCTDDGIVCNVTGTFADPLNNAFYYWCVPRRPIGSFRKYHIECEPGKVFVPLLRKCYIDINNLQNLPPNYGLDDQPDDEDIVKAELKQFKAEEKLKLKEQKLREKLERKIQKEQAKQAAKEAKEQAKVKSISEEDD